MESRAQRFMEYDLHTSVLWLFHVLRSFVLSQTPHCFSENPESFETLYPQLAGRCILCTLLFSYAWDLFNFLTDERWVMCTSTST